MWRRVDLVWTDVSEERIASFLRVGKSASEEPASAGRFKQNLQDTTSQKTAVFICSYRRENLRSYKNSISLWLIY
jgi:hypothetical protein